MLHYYFNSDILLRYIFPIFLHCLGQNVEKIVKSSALKLDSRQLLQGKEGTTWGKIDKLSILSDLVKNKPKHALGRMKLLPQEVYSMTKYL